MKPRYEFGSEVRLIRNVRNDGTYPGTEVGELLMRRGSIGCVYDVGTYLQDQLIYRVHFLDEGRTVGCREEELISASDHWVQNKFEFRDRVSVLCDLKMDGEFVARKGDVAEIENVLREDQDAIEYNIFINGESIRIPERALQAVENETKEQPAVNPESNEAANYG